MTYQRALRSTSGNSVLDQAEREGKRSARRSSGCQTCYRIVIGLCTIASIETVALKQNSYRHMHVILSTVHQAFRFTHEALAEASYGDATAYTGKLQATSHDLRGKHRTTPKASTLIANVIELSG